MPPLVTIRPAASSRPQTVNLHHARLPVKRNPGPG
jgi:hypothetical protein